MKRPTQKDVAVRAGVSRATVSYVLNQNESTRVPISEETRHRVLKAMQELRYEPDVSAQTLRSGKTMTIGVLIVDIHNPHYWQYLAGIEREAHNHGYTILMFHSDLKRTEENVGLRELSRKRVDGVILTSSFGPYSEEEMRLLTDSQRPVVHIWNVESPFDRLAADYHDATQELMAHLIGLGHRRIGLVFGAVNTPIGLDRLEPYYESLKRAGIVSDKSLVVSCGPSIKDGYNAARLLLDRPDRPTAIVAINDLLALAVLRAAADAHIRVPDALSVAGFDDIPFAQYLTPRLTTVHRDTEEAGARAVQLLLDRMKDKSMPIRLEHISARLVIRESTGPAPTDM